MRIGIVVDSACDVPVDFIADEAITVLPVTVQIGNAVLADMRNEDAAWEALATHADGLLRLLRIVTAALTADLD